jgi:hypothetical protein
LISEPKNRLHLDLAKNTLEVPGNHCRGPPKKMDDEAHGTSPSHGNASVDSASSAYFKRRFDGRTTRREALGQRFGNGQSPRSNILHALPSTLTQDCSSGPQIPDPSASDESTSRLSLRGVPSDVSGSFGRRDKSLFLMDDEDGDDTGASDDGENVSHPQHASSISYYRVVYRGVISLLSRPELSSPRSGAYLCYGDIITSSEAIFAEKLNMSTEVPSTPTRREAPNNNETPRANASNTSRNVIRVDRVLTGGYMLDAVDPPVVASDKTPKRGNTLPNVIGPSTFPLACFEDKERKQPLGYLVAEKKHKPILLRLDDIPACESGNFLYKVVSSTPLAIHTGPSRDAPTTKGMLVPGTTHEVSLRVSEGSVSYLRLARRQGWVCTEAIQGARSHIVVMKDVTQAESASEAIASAISFLTSTILTPVPVARCRHRAPRRQLLSTLKKDTIDPTVISCHVPAASGQTLPQSRTGSYDSDGLGHISHERSITSPSSNISLLSDESSLEHSSSHRTTDIVTPDRSSARSTASSSVESPSFFLMRVNAPRGLKILDAPHFQVNNLIHGSHPGGIISSSPSKDLSIKSGNQSIFQTMSGGPHTTTLTSKIGNPAIFDSNTKSRKLPRGCVFEASKRMEASNAFSQGAGLIKLSDNSGWAIVPKREELGDQYRNMSGAPAGIKIGEAGRAFDEVGNAIIHDHKAPVYIRIHAREGLPVALPPNPALDDDVTSPASSTGGTSSLVSAGNGSSVVRGQDSDIASSVGSSFLDTMFRTPRRKGRESDESEKSRREAGNPPRAPASERLPFSNIIPCGAYVEVDGWAKAQESDGRFTEYARLRGGQGWIPRSLNGKPITEIISPPETRFGSFWFRVQDKEGIKVRLGPSRRSPSIKSDDGVYFRFECGEFLRASEIVTFFGQRAPSECYAKLYRNRHIRLYGGHGEIRPLSSLTVQAEWVQVFGQEELFLDECVTEPRIERHRQGWRYNVVLDARVEVRKGPSFESETNGVVLLGGESILVNERVTCSDDTITWLRLKDGQGWVHTIDGEGATLMIPHSIRHRNGLLGRPTKPGRPEQEDVAYNTIIARLFHNSSEVDGGDIPSNAPQSRSRTRLT